MPRCIGSLLQVVAILAGYGQHMLDTIAIRAAAPSFNAIAACFGTANLSTIIFHLHRGIMRLLALRRFLLARAATGRDIDFIEPRTRAPDTQPAPLAAPRAPRAPSVPHWDDSSSLMPTLEELDRQVRRRTLGRTIGDICLDLGIAPRFCTGPFWDALLEIMLSLGGSVATVMQTKHDREQAFLREQDRKPGSNWDWLNLSRDALHQVLGFFIGEEPVAPLDPSSAAATGPP
jgi:hypothetical protein